MMINDAKTLKYRFLQKVVDPLNKKSRDQFSTLSHRPIVYNIIMSNHFFERVLDRDIDKGKLGSIFNKLFENHYCELLYYFIKNREEIYRTQHDPENRHCIHVKYKGIGVVFLLGFSEKTCDSHDSMDLEIIPITIIKNEDFIRDTVMVFDLNKQREELKLLNYDVSNERRCILN